MNKNITTCNGYAPYCSGYLSSLSEWSQKSGSLKSLLEIKALMPLVCCLDEIIKLIQMNDQDFLSSDLLYKQA